MARNLHLDEFRVVEGIGFPLGHGVFRRLLESIRILCSTLEWDSTWSTSICPPCAASNSSVRGHRLVLQHRAKFLMSSGAMISTISSLISFGRPRKVAMAAVLGRKEVQGCWSKSLGTDRFF